ncbi:MAG: hypothetical protein LBP51_07510, partial [Deferribacteraceae bacterium]|nr:hypothetical protein [Deferribacteraceae bacterium]
REKIIQIDEARRIINKICARYGASYTAIEAQGGWYDESKTLLEEETLVYIFNYTSESVVAAIMDDILKELNQNTILLERRDISGTFYSRKPLKD